MERETERERDLSHTHWFEVSVDVSHLVHILQSRENLSEERASLFLLQPLFGHDVVKKFTSRTVLRELGE